MCRRVGSIGPSEDLLEVDFEDGVIARVGNQYGVGRVVKDPSLDARPQK